MSANYKGTYLFGGAAISYIIIDGYNVIGIYHKDLEKARAGLVELLARYRKTKDHNISVVFDGYKNGLAAQQASYSGHVKVIYTRLGERADDLIKKTVSQERREWIVVTADRDIADHAWSVGSVPVPPERFMNAIAQHRELRAYEVPMYEDNDEDLQPRRGNPHQPSKKEKALRRVLSKL